MGRNVVALCVVAAAGLTGVAQAEVTFSSYLPGDVYNPNVFYQANTNFQPHDELGFRFGRKHPERIPASGHGRLANREVRVGREMRRHVGAEPPHGIPCDDATPDLTTAHCWARVVER